MRKEIRTARYDRELRLEAYRFAGTAQSFPDHFHDYYVIGAVEAGTRRLSCKNVAYTVRPGDLLIFNPNDSHGCAPCGGSALSYRCINVPRETMLSRTEEIAGERALPVFSENVIADGELSGELCALHRMIMDGAGECEKEEALLLFLSRLLERYGKPFLGAASEYGAEIERVCAFMEAHFGERMTLDDLCRCGNVSKSTLLRAFTNSKGITPYRYLQAIRIGKAKELLERGASPVEAALRTGFSDQSHFSNFFHLFIGLSPAAYRRIFRAPDRKGGDQTG